MEPSFQRSDVEQIGHVMLPATARQLQAHIERGIDAAVWVKFELPASDIDGFLASSGYTELSTTQRAVENWHLPTKAPWWAPDDITEFRSGHIRRESAGSPYAGHILVSADGDLRTVYLFVTSL